MIPDRKQLDHCMAEEAFDEHGLLTMWALGGYVPAGDTKEIEEFFRTSPPYAYKRRNWDYIEFAKFENVFRTDLLSRMNHFLTYLSVDGFGNVSRACKASGLNRTLAFELKNKIPNFRKAWDEIFESVTDALEEEGLNRAIKGTEEPVFYQGVVCGHKMVKSDTLLALMLKGRRAEIYRDQVYNEHAGPGGGPLSLNATGGVMVVPSVTNVDDWEKAASESQSELKDNVRQK